MREGWKNDDEAYSELYLDDAMHNLGDMVEYAVCDLGFDRTLFSDGLFSPVSLKSSKTEIPNI